jgi:hypothetical protein
MAPKKRASTQSQLLTRAVKAGRSALREAEKRVPPDLRKQLERGFRDGQKTVETAIKQVQTRLDRTARQQDLDRALKLLDGLSKQVQQLARSMSAPTAPAAPAKPARKPARRTAGAAKAKTAPKPAAARKPAPTRRPAAKKPRASATPAATPVPPPPEPGPIPQHVDTGEGPDG